MGFEYQVEFSPEANQAIQDRADYIALRSGSPLEGQRFMDGVYSFCESLSIFPHRGRKRDDLRVGMRITNYKGTTIIPYLIDDDAKIVYILYAIQAVRTTKES